MSERGETEYREFASARATQLFRLAFLMCGDWHEAEDLVQTTLASLFVAWNRVRRRSSMDTYARRVLVNAFLSQRRLKRSRETPTAQFADLSAPAADADLRLTLLAALLERDIVTNADSYGFYGYNIYDQRPDGITVFIQVGNGINHTLPQVDRARPPGSMAEWEAVVENPAWHLKKGWHLEN